MIKFGSLDLKDAKIGDVQIKKMAIGNEVIWQKNVNPLPSGYTEVKYLYSSGTQYINLGNIVIQEGLCFDFDAQFIESSWTSTSWVGFAGCNQLGIWILNRRYACIKYNNIQMSSKNTDATGSRHNFRNDGYLFYYDNNLIQEQSTEKDQKTITASFTLFDTGRYQNRNVNAIFYYFKLRLNNELITNLIPCLDINNIPCFYDTVTQQTFYNRGTGTFGYETMDGTVVAPT